MLWNPTLWDGLEVLIGKGMDATLRCAQSLALRTQDGRGKR